MIKWLKDDTVIKNNSYIYGTTEFKILSFNSTLGDCEDSLCGASSTILISNVTTDHAGQYTCCAYNKEGNATETAKLAVIDGK